MSSGGGDVVFVFDVDGTLLDDEERLSEENKRAVMEASKVAEVILASGRMLKSVLKFSRENFGREFPTIAYNGGVVYIPDRGIVHQRGIKPEIAVSVIEELRKRGVHRQAYVDDELLGEEDNEEIRTYAEHSGVDYRIVPDLVEVVKEKGSTKILAISESGVLDEIRDELSKVFDDLKIFKSFPTYLDFVPKDVGKAEALRVLAREMEFDLDEVVAFGDNDNDADMIREVGFGVAMGNATPAVRKVADIIAPSNNESGVAKVVFDILSGRLDPFLRMDRP